MKLFLVLVIAVTAVAAVIPDGCSYGELDKCYTTESVIDYKQFPKGITEIDKVCGLLKDGDDCVKSFNQKCVKNPVARNISDQLQSYLTNVYDDVCNVDDGSKDGYLNQSIACYTKLGNQFFDYHSRYVALVEKVGTYEKKAQFPAFCCAFWYIHDNFANTIAKQCKQIYYYLNSDLILTLQIPFNECPLAVYRSCRAKTLNPAQRADFDKITDINNLVVTKYRNAMPTFYPMFDPTA